MMFLQVSLLLVLVLVLELLGFSYVGLGPLPHDASVWQLNPLGAYLSGLNPAMQREEVDSDELCSHRCAVGLGCHTVPPPDGIRS